MRPAPARSGDPVAAIDTPALVVDADALDRNVERMAEFARAHGVRLRPHAKTHKCAAIARRQLAAGAVGVCVQKLGEAEALADAGVDSIYLSNEVIGEAKLARLAALARRMSGAALARRARLAVTVDSTLGADRLARAVHAAGASIEVFVEIDVGHGRCGVPPAAAGALARQVVAHGLAFAGLQAYHGSAQHRRTAAEREAAIRHAAAAVRAAQASITALGIACPLVTGAGTGSFPIEAASGLWGELQAGSYVFLDRDYADNERDPRAPPFEHALFVLGRTVSRGAAHAVIDAGHKSHAIDSGLPRPWRREGLEFVNGGDEHGILRGAPAALPALDEAVWLVPGHCDPTVNLHDHYVVVRGGLDAGVVEAVWPIEARGRVD